MRKFFALSSLLLAAAFALGACQTSGTGSPGLPDVSQAQAAIAQVQTVTKQVCAFVPTASTIANIFATGVPEIGAATSIANGICDALNSGPKLGRRGARKPVYRGVAIKGRSA